MAVSSNIRALMVNDADDAVINQTKGTEVSTLPLTNLQWYSNSNVFRSTDTSEVQFTLVFPDPRILSGIVLRRHNISQAGTWRIEIFSDQAMTNRIYDSTAANGGEELLAIEQKTLGELEWVVDMIVSPVLGGRYHDSDHWFDDMLGLAIRITVKDPENTLGFFDITRIYAGRALQPEINFSYGHKFGWLGKTNQKRTAGGSVFGKKTASIRSIKFDLSWLNESDRPHFVNAIQRVQDDTEWYVSLFPGLGGQKERHYAMSCIFTSLPEFDGNFEGNFQSAYSLGEA